jgi:hypothetical protein
MHGLKASAEQRAAAVSLVDRLLADGLPLRSACEQAVAQLNVPSSPKLTGAEFVQRLWARHPADRPPTAARAGVRRRRFVPSAD